LEQKLQEVGSELPGTVLGFVGSLTAFIFNSLTVLILTIYFTVNLPRMRAGVARLLGRQDRKDFREIYDQSVQRVGGYVLGNLVVCVFAGVASFLALVVIGVPFFAIGYLTMYCLVKSLKQDVPAHELIPPKLRRASARATTSW
jgi:predicted PurR-regulated permease PerM